MRISNQISITGRSGVGSTSLVSILKERLAKFPYRFVSGGAIMRAKAEELGFSSIEAFAEYNRYHPEKGYDLQCDMIIAKFAEHDYVVCDGRLPHYFMPHAFKVLLTCSPEVRAERRQRDYPHMSIDEVLAVILKRDEDDECRYAALYPDSIWEPEKFDLVIDTSLFSKEEVANQVLGSYSRRPVQNALV